MASTLLQPNWNDIEDGLGLHLRVKSANYIAVNCHKMGKTTIFFRITLQKRSNVFFKSELKTTTILQMKFLKVRQKWLV